MIYKPGLTREQFEGLAFQIIATHIIETFFNNMGRASIFLSGGSTPGPIYDRLSSIQLPWNHLDVGLVDERWVDEKNAGSNARLIRRTLLKGHAKSTNFVPMKTEHRTPDQGQKAVQAAYSAMISRQSMAVLGMGTDGHVCSWFPNADGLTSAVNPANLNVVQAISAKQSAVTGEYLDRMTLTLSALKTCLSVLLLITGDEKRRVLESALNDPASNLPVSHILALPHLTILHAA